MSAPELKPCPWKLPAKVGVGDSEWPSWVEAADGEVICEMPSTESGNRADFIAAAINAYPQPAEPVRGEGERERVEAIVGDILDTLDRRSPLNDDVRTFTDRIFAALRSRLAREHAPDYTDWEIRPDEDGVDEIVGSGFLHMERLDDDVWWFGFYAARDGKRERLTWTIGPRGCQIVEWPQDAPATLTSIAKEVADRPERSAAREHEGEQEPACPWKGPFVVEFNVTDDEWDIRDANDVWVCSIYDDREDEAHAIARALTALYARSTPSTSTGEGGE